MSSGRKVTDIGELADLPLNVDRLIGLNADISDVVKVMQMKNPRNKGFVCFFDQGEDDFSNHRYFELFYDADATDIEDVDVLTLISDNPLTRYKVI